MPLASMTGFARSQGSAGNYHWVWELKSVNGKGFDLRLRLPQGRWLGLLSLDAAAEAGGAAGELGDQAHDHVGLVNELASARERV